MNVEIDLPRLDNLRQIMEVRQRLLLASHLAKFNIPRTYLSIMEQSGEIERVSRGVYRSMSAFIEDESSTFQPRYSSTIFSHGTALYLHGLTDRTPLIHSITVPSGYYSELLNNRGHKISYLSRDLFNLGVISMNTSHGNQVRATDLERTICDIVRSRNQRDIQVRNVALKGYVRKKDRTFDRLYSYTQRFHPIHR